MSGEIPQNRELILSMDRARCYRALAQLFREPDAESIAVASNRNLPELCVALARLSEPADGPDSTAAENETERAIASDLINEARLLCELFKEAGIDRLENAHVAAFDESSPIRCAPTEMDQLDGTPQLEMTRTFEMADVGGFYKAFGVELDDGGQRVDHITAELEFMNLLAVKEAVALQEEGAGENARICRDASRSFLRDHLMRWAPRLGDGLAESEGDPIYTAAGRLLSGFIVFDAEKIDAAGAPVHKVNPEAKSTMPESH